mgnify:CR=1 FL=1
MKDMDGEFFHYLFSMKFFYGATFSYYCQSYGATFSGFNYFYGATFL